MNCDLWILFPARRSICHRREHPSLFTNHGLVWPSPCVCVPRPQRAACRLCGRNPHVAGHAGYQGRCDRHRIVAEAEPQTVEGNAPAHSQSETDQKHTRSFRCGNRLLSFIGNMRLFPFVSFPAALIRLLLWNGRLNQGVKNLIQGGIL
jgi:hypothetical protein